MCSQLQNPLLAQSPPCKWPARNSSLFFYVEVIGAVSRCIWWWTKVHCYLMGLSELLLHMQLNALPREQVGAKVFENSVLEEKNCALEANILESKRDLSSYESSVITT